MRPAAAIDRADCVLLPPKDEYSLLNSKHFIGIHGYMLVYSINSKQSFDMIRILRDKILNHLVSAIILAVIPKRYQLMMSQGADWVPLVIVGNKSDLKSDQRQVPTEAGRRLAEEFSCSFTESSAWLNTNVAKAFEQLIFEMEKSQNPSEQPGGSKCNIM